MVILCPSIETIPKVITKLCNLRRLTIKETLRTSFPEDLKNLEEVELLENPKITEFPMELIKTKKLRSLCVSGCSFCKNIEEINKIAKIKNLKILGFNLKNSFGSFEIPNNFEKLPKLREISLYGGNSNCFDEIQLKQILKLTKL